MPNIHCSALLKILIRLFIISNYRYGEIPYIDIICCRKALALYARVNVFKILLKENLLLSSQCSFSFIPRKQQCMYQKLVGFLTCFISECPSHFFFSKQWLLLLFRDLVEAYSSGSVQDFHLIPFHCTSVDFRDTIPMSSTKLFLFTRDAKILL